MGAAIEPDAAGVPALPFPNPYASPYEQEARQHGDATQTAIPSTELPTDAEADADTSALDEQTARAIAAASNEYNTRVRAPARRASDMVPTPEFSAPELTARLAPPGKKRPGDASKKQPPAKKLKTEGSDRGTPLSNRFISPTPSTLSGKASNGGKTASKPNAKSKRASVADDDSDSDQEVYCICRKPDDHNWMIGCDGGCEDWFHGKCVNMAKEDQALVDKYLCPNCEAAGCGVTTWKPMCRADGCRNPAILKKGSESKYCSRDCGVAFMRAALGRAGAQLHGTTPKKRGAKPARDGPDDEAARSIVGPLGGVLRPAELKALADAAPTIDSFRRLGSETYPTPPPTASPELTAKDEARPEGLSAASRRRLDEIEAKKATLAKQYQTLKDRSTYIAMLKARIPKLADSLGLKDVCGYDAVWSLDDAAFDAWRAGPGAGAFATGQLDVPEQLGGTDDPSPICTRKKKCPRHGAGWHKLLLDEVRLEMALVGNAMRQAGNEEKEVRARAGQAGQARGGETLAEGWFEAVAAVAAVAATPPENRNKADAAVEAEPEPEVTTEGEPAADAMDIDG